MQTLTYLLTLFKKSEKKEALLNKERRKRGGIRTEGIKGEDTAREESVVE